MDSSPDRIANPWGVRTPYAPGTPWPVRTDMHLAEGTGEDDVERWVRSATILHSNGDALDIAVRDGRIVGVRGRPADRVNRGRLGPKDLYGWQANHSPDRLTRPLVRENGRLVECDWGTAMDRITSRTKTLLDERGPGAVGFHTTGQRFLEEYYTLAVLAHAGIRTNHLDGNTRLCTATAAAALAICTWPPPVTPSTGRCSPRRRRPPGTRTSWGWSPTAIRRPSARCAGPTP